MTEPGHAEDTRLRRLLREPLVHFVLLGTLLFVGWAALGGGGAPGAGGERILVTRGRIATLAELFERTWQRPPTPGELQGLVDEWVREEIAYREALAMGLDRDDTIIRRRLRQKLEFVVDDLSPPDQPTDEELAAYLAEHANDYRHEARVTFEHVFVSRDRHGEGAAAVARDVLVQLGQGAAPATLGDPLDLPRRFERVTAGDLARSFGQPFAAAVVGTPAGGWHGPLSSGLGLHLVHVEAVVPAAAPALVEIRDQVAGDWAAARRRETSEAFYDRLARRYQVVVEPAEDDPGERGTRPGAASPGGGR